MADTHRRALQDNTNANEFPLHSANGDVKETFTDVGNDLVLGTYASFMIHSSQDNPLHPPETA